VPLEGGEATGGRPPPDNTALAGCPLRCGYSSAARAFRGGTSVTIAAMITARDELKFAACGYAGDLWPGEPLDVLSPAGVPQPRSPSARGPDIAGPVAGAPAIPIGKTTERRKTGPLGRGSRMPC
jgi:hypothetical protein